MRLTRAQQRFTDDILTRYDLVKVDDKGNCFYDSVLASSAYGVRSAAAPAAALRCDLGAHMRAHRHLYEDFVTFDGTYEEYLVNMEQTLEWATEIEIVAFANLSGRRLKIANQPRAVWQTIDPADEFASNEDITIHLFYNGTHYDLLLPKIDDKEDEDNEEDEEEGDGYVMVSVWIRSVACSSTIFTHTIIHPVTF